MPKQIVEAYSMEVRDYLKRRGLDQSILLKEKIYEYTMRGSGKPIMGFPFYINQTLVNVKYFDVRWKLGADSPKWWQMRKDFGTRSIFLGMQSLSFDEGEKKEVIITEGEWDYLTWKQCGYKNAVSVPQGAPAPNAKNFDHEFDYANDKYVQSFFADVESIIFSTDGDAPGKALRNQLALIFGKERCKYINYPGGYKDANEVFAGDEKKGLKALGKEGVEECYKNISSFPIAGVIKPSDCREDLELIKKNGFIPGIGIGMPEIDRLFTLKPKQITFVTGVPSAGKSTFVRWYVTELIRHNSALNLKFGMFTPENRPVAREYAKIAEVMTGQYYREGWKNSMNDSLRDKTMRFIEKHFFVVSPDRKNYESWNGTVSSDRINTLDSILKYLVHLKKTENIFGFVIDAWNKIEHEQPRNMTESTFISQQLDYLINFCDLWDVHGIIIVHPRKIEQQGANYKMPSLYDIKGSSAWKEKADIGIVLHRYMNKRKKAQDIPEDADEDDKYYVDPDTPTVLRTEKIRFEEVGVMDRVKLIMDSKRGGRFFLFEEKKKVKYEPIEGKISPPEPEEDEEEILPF